MATPQQYGAPAITAAIANLASAIAAKHGRTRNLLLLGIANGGIVLAERLEALLKQAGLKPGLGTIDISFHRDDIGANPITKESSPTFIPHDVNDATVILIDDVLYSGRTVKAALDELFDHGRPERVELAVLVDRGGRKLPISADYCGLVVEAGSGEKVSVHLSNTTPVDDSVVVRPASAKPTHTRALAS